MLFYDSKPTLEIALLGAAGAFPASSGLVPSLFASLSSGLLGLCLFFVPASKLLSSGLLALSLLLLPASTCFTSPYPSAVLRFSYYSCFFCLLPLASNRLILVLFYYVPPTLCLVCLTFLVCKYHMRIAISGCVCKLGLARHRAGKHAKHASLIRKEAFEIILANMRPQL